MAVREQRLAQRYYQRPDAPQVSFDPTLTSLRGFTGRTNIDRNSGLWQLNAALWGVSPGFESNDLGFLGQADRAGAHAVLMRRHVTPDRLTRSWSVWGAKWWTWNFNRDLQGDGVQGNGSVTLRNYWTMSAGATWRRRVQNDRLTRGGCRRRIPKGGAGARTLAPTRGSRWRCRRWRMAHGIRREDGTAWLARP
jgi:hypothetical protein